MVFSTTATVSFLRTASPFPGKIRFRYDSCPRPDWGATGWYLLLLYGICRRQDNDDDDAGNDDDEKRRRKWYPVGVVVVVVVRTSCKDRWIARGRNR